MCAGKIHFHIQKTQIDQSPESTWTLLRNIHTIARLCPPWLRIECEAASASIEEGAQFQIRMFHGALKGIWKFRVTSLRKGFLIGFEILSPRGQIWVVWTKVLPGDSPHQCIIEDRLEFSASTLFGKPSSKVEKSIREILYYRHRTLKNDLQALGPGDAATRQSVMIAGGSGLVGKHLAKMLKMRGHEVRILSTQIDERYLHWEPEKGMIQPEFFEKTDTVINLAGFPIACRWNPRNRQRILESRLKSTHQLVKTLLRLDHPPKQFIQASAVGYYGYHNQPDVSEDYPQGEGFLAEVCEKWEKQTQALEEPAAHIRKKIVRFGVVLTPDGGALRKILPIFERGLGGKIGKGQQLFPWISINDLCRALVFLIENPQLQGVFNACSPQPVTNAEFTKTLTQTLRRPGFLPIPALVMKLLYGQMGEEALLGGVGAIPEQLTANGFQFQDVNLEEALRSLLGRS